MKILTQRNFIINAICMSMALSLALIIPSIANAQTECPMTQAAVISTAGNSNALGSISQSFIVPPGYETISGRVRFLSNEYPVWYGTAYNDTYLVRISASGGSSILASGNVNSASWSSGILGYNGKTPEITFTFDAAAYVGQTVSIYFEVRDVGDTYYDSALAIDAVKVIQTQDYVHAESGNMNANGSISGLFGQGVKITFSNVNVLGTTIQVTGSNGRFHQSIILPMGSVTFTFSRFGDEPMGWNFDIRTESDAFIVNYEVESTWVEGMPTNPCY